MRKKCEKSRRDAIKAAAEGGGTGAQASAMTMSKSDLVRESKKIIIMPSMRLVWDNALNRMVWK